MSIAGQRGFHVWTPRKAARHKGTLAEKIEKATALKEEGTAILKSGHMEKAVETYERAAGVLRHRVILSAAAEIEGRSVEQVVAALLEREEVPR